MAPVVVVTVPFFALVICGYAAVRARVLPLEAIGGLNVFVLFFALPCMLYRFASITPIARLLDPSVLGTYLLCALAMVALSVAAERRWRRTSWNDTAFGALVAAFPNSGFLGVPLLVALLGTQAAGPVIVTLVVDLLVTSSLCVALSRLDAADEQGALRAAWQGLKGMLRNPLPWAIALGCLSTATGWQLPAAAMHAVEMLAAAASPAALFTLGAMLARPAPGTAPANFAAAPSAPAAVGGVLRLAAFKVLLHPVLVWATGSAAIALGVPLDRFALMVLVLTAALPSASSVPILAERFKADAAALARVVFLTTVVAFATVPLAVMVLR